MVWNVTRSQSWYLTIQLMVTITFLHQKHHPKWITMNMRSMIFSHMSNLKKTKVESDLNKYLPNYFIEDLKKAKKSKKGKQMQHHFVGRTNKERLRKIWECIVWWRQHFRKWRRYQRPFYRFKYVRRKWRLWWKK